LLKEIRLHAFAYIHGHSVGGTNPSLLEALGATEINLLYDCDFNREVAEASALYWTKETGNLTAIINKVDTMLPEAGKKLGQLAKDRIRTSYSWGKICDAYEDVFRS
jgi:rhamnosyltransferase